LKELSQKLSEEFQVLFGMVGSCSFFNLTRVDQVQHLLMLEAL